MNNENKKKSGSGCGTNILITFIVIFSIFMAMLIHDGVHNLTHSTSKETTEQVVTPSEKVQAVEETEAETEKETTFQDLLAESAGEEAATEVYSILTEKLGFTTITFVERSGETWNYKIACDGTYVMITAVAGDCRVWIPGSYTFYEDGTVIMTAAELAAVTIDHNDARTYYIMAQDAVKQYLKYPDSADFPSFITQSEEIAMSKKDNLIVVESYVDCKNSLGIEGREKWAVQFTVVDMDTYSYTLNFIKIGDETAGTYQKMDE